MELREYRPEDCREMAELFYETVHTVNRRDYTEGQVMAWAPGMPDLEQWNRSFLEHYTLVAWEGGKIAGFGDIDRTGYLDRLYVHKDFQGKGIATAICERLEQHFQVDRITTHASITARPFFEGRGYRAVREQQVERRGEWLTNFVMEKVMERSREVVCREKGIAYCGLACCLCEEQEACAGCRNGGCGDRERCGLYHCCRKKGLEGCWECGKFPCEEPMLKTARVRAFGRFAREYGMEALMDALEMNVEQGIVYHYADQLAGDYDRLETEERVLELLMEGCRLVGKTADRAPSGLREEKR